MARFHRSRTSSRYRAVFADGRPDEKRARAPKKPARKGARK